MTGGGPGIMEAANRGAKESGTLSVGCNIVLPHEQAHNPYLDRFVTMEYFFVRKELLRKYSFAFIVLPGGFGTLDELMEALKLIQTGKTRKIPIILVCSDYWKGLLDWFRSTIIAEGMASPEDMDLIQVIDEPARIVEAIFSHYETCGFELSAIEKQKQLCL